MKRTIKLCIAIAGLILIDAWIMKQVNEIEQAQWLIGTWENKISTGSIYETWTRKSESEFSGQSYMVKEKDTLVFETIALVSKQDGLFYIPTVNNQNNASPVPFLSTRSSDTQLVFENPKHDFPQVITYTKISQDSLVAEISGIKDGEQRAQTFPMKRLE